nr:MAG TPA: hypothetical protein [Caudoviricetes sp.]
MRNYLKSLHEQRTTLPPYCHISQLLKRCTAFPQLSGA